MMNKLKVLVICILYVLISSATPTLNKWLYLNENFSYLTLSFLQCLSTFIGLQLCEKFDLFSVKSVHIDTILVPATLFCCFVTIMNMSLASNSLATYHIVKTIFIPVLMLIKSLLKLKFRLKLLHISWGLIITGALILIYYDTNFDSDGTILLSTGFLFYVFYEMVLKRKQAELQMNTLQLLYYFSLISSIILCIGIPFVGVPMQLLTIQWTYTKFALLSLSNVLVFLNNTSVYWLSANISNRRISTLLMYLKICCSVLQGWYLFSEGLTLNQLVGLGVHIIGTVYCDNIILQSMTNSPIRPRSTFRRQMSI